MSKLIFKLLVFVGNLTEYSFLPIFRFYNDNKTESYTLRYDGFIVIKYVSGGAKAIIPMGFASDKLLAKVILEFDKVGKHYEG